MKIIQITASYKPAFIYGGPTQSVSKLCEVLSALEDVELEVLTTTANGKTELDVPTSESINVDGVSVRYFKRITKDHTHFSPALLTHLRQRINKGLKTEKPVVHIQAWWNLVSILSCQLAKWYNIPVLLSPRGMLTGYTLGNRNSLAKKMIHQLFGKRLLPYCHIHVTSEQEKADVLHITSPRSITLIANLLNLPGVGEKAESGNIQSQTTPHPTPTLKFRLLYLSRIEEKKGLELLFEALKGVDFDWQLTLAGSGSESYIKQLQEVAGGLGIAAHIHWVGQVNDTEKFTLMAGHELLVLTSYNENFANVVVESLSVGTPVLLTESVGLAAYVQKNRLGWVSTIDPADIRKQLNLANHDQHLRDQIRNIAPEMIYKDFNAHTLGESYLSLYKKISHG